MERGLRSGVPDHVLDDSAWSVEGDDLPAGTKVKVIGVEGIVLRVARAD